MVIGEKAHIIEGRLFENKSKTLLLGSLLVLSGNEALDVMGVSKRIEAAFKSILSIVALPKYARVQVTVERLEDGEDLEPVKEAKEEEEGEKETSEETEEAR